MNETILRGLNIDFYLKTYITLLRKKKIYKIKYLIVKDHIKPIYDIQE